MRGRIHFFGVAMKPRSICFAIIAVDDEGAAEIVDSSYRTAEEAFEAWPEAAPKTHTNDK